MPRFFTDPSSVTDNKITITNTDVNHIKNVLRMAPGDKLTVCDTKGNDYVCTIEQMDKNEVTLNIENVTPSVTELKQKLYLFQGLPKSDKMELIIQKAVELGVYEIIPVQTARAIVKIEPAKEAKKITRWNQISEAAAKQAQRGIIPNVHTPMSFNQALEYAKELDFAIIPYEKATDLAKTREMIASLKNKNSIAIFIGPEGGFDDSEIELAEKAGVVPITLGKRILRTETASLTTLSILMFNLE